MSEQSERLSLRRAADGLALAVESMRGPGGERVSSPRVELWLGSVRAALAAPDELAEAVRLLKFWSPILHGWANHEWPDDEEVNKALWDIDAFLKRQEQQHGE